MYTPRDNPSHSYRPHIRWHTEARRQLLDGIDEVADMVKPTVGPSGHCIVIHRIIGYPLITRDGVTVARHINPQDPAKKTGAALCKEAAGKTDELAGDGTSTCVILLQALVHAGFRLLEAGMEPISMVRGLKKATAVVTADIERQSASLQARIEADAWNEVDILSRVAALAARDKEIGKLIGEALEKVGTDGIMTVDENKLQRTYVETASGLEIKSRHLSPSFPGGMREMTMELQNPYLLISAQPLIDMEEIKRVLHWCEWEKRPLLVLASDISRDVEGLLTAFRNESKVLTAAVKAPGDRVDQWELLEDVAAVTGATLIGDERGLSVAVMERSMLGQAEQVSVGRGRSVITGPKADEKTREAYMNRLKTLISQSKNDAESKRLQKRVARLAGGIAVIYVGGATDLALRELKDRVQDAVHAARLAQTGGVVWGGGTAYIHATKALDTIKAKSADEQAGIEIMRTALCVPLRQIISNAGVSADPILEQSRQWAEGTGYDALRRTFADFYETGLIEPAMVPILALRNAASIAGSLFTVEVSYTPPRRHG